MKNNNYYEKGRVCQKIPRSVEILQKWRILNGHGAYDDLLHAAAVVTPCGEKGGLRNEFL